MSLWLCQKVILATLPLFWQSQCFPCHTVLTNIRLILTSSWEEIWRQIQLPKAPLFCLKTSKSSCLTQKTALQKWDRKVSSHPPPTTKVASVEPKIDGTFLVKESLLILFLGLKRQNVLDVNCYVKRGPCCLDATRVDFFLWVWLWVIKLVWRAVA